MNEQPLIGELGRLLFVIDRGIFCSLGKANTLPTFTIQLNHKPALRLVRKAIVIGADFVALSNMQIVSELFHILVHVHNQEKHVADCTANSYHNRRFLHMALQAGCYVGRHPLQGWSITKLYPGQQSKRDLAAPIPQAVLKRDQLIYNKLKLNETMLLQAKREMRQMLRNKQPARVCFLKYVCDCLPPHNSIRSGRRPNGLHPLRIRCEVCGSVFRDIS